MNKVFPVIALVFTFAACSKKKESSSPFPGSSKARSAEEAISWMSTEDQAKFNSWKSSAIKSCNAGKIFGGDNTPSVSGLDLSVLYTKTGNSLSLVQETTGEKITLGAFVKPAGLEQS